MLPAEHFHKRHEMERFAVNDDAVKIEQQCPRPKTHEGKVSGAVGPCKEDSSPRSGKRRWRCGRTRAWPGSRGPVNLSPLLQDHRHAQIFLSAPQPDGHLLARLVQRQEWHERLLIPRIHITN